jgi:hypothetical protein
MYYLWQGGEMSGPLSAEELREATAFAGADAQVCRAVDSEWIAWSDADDIRAEIAAPPPHESIVRQRTLARERILPAVAVFKSGAHARYSDVLCFGESELTWGKLPHTSEIPEGVGEPGGLDRLRPLLDERGSVSWENLASACLYAPAEFGSVWTFSYRSGRPLQVEWAGGSRQWILPPGAAEIAERALQAACAEKFETTEQTSAEINIPSGITPRVVFWFFAALVTAAILLMNVGLPIYNGTWEGMASAPATLIVGFVSFLAVPVLLIPLPLRWREAYLRRRLFRSKGAPLPDLSGRQPVSRPVLGRCLKWGGAGLFLVAYFGVMLFPISSWLPEATATQNTMFIGYTMVFYTLIAGVVFVGYRLSMESAESRIARDDRAPILYLRAFEDDGRSSFNPTGLAAQVLGVQAAHFLLNINPFRIIRMAATAPADTAEEQMADYFRGYGPLVAIGRPGERFPLGGAARIYVPDDAWQATVIDFMHKSQFVVIQPAETSGVWWEVERLLETLPPAQVLLCLVNFRGKENRYTLFRWRFEETTGRELPRSLGDATFCCFRDDWRPLMLPGRLRNPFTWLFRGCAFDFGETLKPFLAYLQGGSRLEPEHEKSRGQQLLRWAAVPAILLLFMLLGLGLSQVGEPLAAPREAAAALADTKYVLHDLNDSFAVRLRESWKPTATPGVYAIGEPPMAFVQYQVLPRDGLPEGVHNHDDLGDYYKSLIMAQARGAAWDAETSQVPHGEQTWVRLKFKVNEGLYAPTAETVQACYDGDSAFLVRTWTRTSMDTTWEPLLEEARWALQPKSAAAPAQ